MSVYLEFRPRPRFLECYQLLLMPRGDSWNELCAVVDYALTAPAVIFFNASPAKRGTSRGVSPLMLSCVQIQRFIVMFRPSVSPSVGSSRRRADRKRKHTVDIRSSRSERVSSFVLGPSCFWGST